jgi:hypothetical protein
MTLFGDAADRLAACGASVAKCRSRAVSSHAASRRCQSLTVTVAKLVAVLALVAAGVTTIGTALAQAPDGAACATNTDCSSGTCNVATGLCSRRTAVGAPDGAACGRNSECHSGICNLVTRQCSPRGGADSRPAPDGAACAADADCSSGLCDRAARVCRAKAATENPQGTACTTNDDCRPGRCNAATGLCTRR